MRVSQHSQMISQMFLIPKKEWINDTSIQSENIKSVPTLETLQDGKNLNDQRSHSAKRLDDKNGSKGCLICSADQTGG